MFGQRGFVFGEELICAFVEELLGLLGLEGVFVEIFEVMEDLFYLDCVFLGVVCLLFYHYFEDIQIIIIIGILKKLYKNNTKRNIIISFISPSSRIFHYLDFSSYYCLYFPYSPYSPYSL